MIHYQADDRVRIITIYDGAYRGKTGRVIGTNCIEGMIRVKFDEPVVIDGVVFENDVFAYKELRPILLSDGEKII